MIPKNSQHNTNYQCCRYQQQRFYRNSILLRLLFIQAQFWHNALLYGLLIQLGLINKVNRIHQVQIILID